MLQNVQPLVLVIVADRLKLREPLLPFVYLYLIWPPICPLYLWDMVSSHYRASIRVIITEEVGELVLLSDYLGWRGDDLHIPDIPWGCLLVVGMGSIWLADKVVRNIGPDLGFLPCWLSLLQDLVWLHKAGYCHLLLLPVDVNRLDSWKMNSKDIATREEDWTLTGKMKSRVRE